METWRKITVLTNSLHNVKWKLITPHRCSSVLACRAINIPLHVPWLLLRRADAGGVLVGTSKDGAVKLCVLLPGGNVKVKMFCACLIKHHIQGKRGKELFLEPSAVSAGEVLSKLLLLNVKRTGPLGKHLFNAIVLFCAFITPIYLI